MNKNSASCAYAPIVIFNPEKQDDYLCLAFSEGLKKLGISCAAVASSNGFNCIHTDDELVDLAKKADYIFVIWGRRPKADKHKYGIYKGHLLDKINLWNKIVYIDGSEWTFDGNLRFGQLMFSFFFPSWRRREPWLNEAIKEKAGRYFKRECYKKDLKSNVKPLLFTALSDYFPSNYNIEKDIDLFVSFGQKKTGLRLFIELYCKWLKYKNQKYKIIIENKLPLDIYKNYLLRSRIAVDAWGGGDCNARFYEILSCKTMLLYQKHRIEHPFEFVDGYQATSFSTFSEFRKKLDFCLINRAFTEEVAIRGYQHLLDYHTAEKRVQQLLDQL